MRPLSDEGLYNYKIKILKLVILPLKRHKKWDYFIKVGIKSCRSQWYFYEEYEIFLFFCFLK